MFDRLHEVWSLKLRWELKEQYKGYEAHQYNIIMDVLGGWSKETDWCAITGRAKDYSSLRESTEGGFIGDAEHCKNTKVVT